jgi:starvation-inducible DNA-binding protein
MTVDTGTKTEATDEIAAELSRLLADTYTLYIKTHGYHWNVTGPMFRSLHLMFEEQYIDLAEAVDVIAERIRALDHVAPGSYTEFGELTSIEDGRGVPEAMEMVNKLAAGHETVARTAHSVVAKAEAAGDVATADLATQRIDIHEKTAWMLRATAS